MIPSQSHQILASTVLALILPLMFHVTAQAQLKKELPIEEVIYEVPLNDAKTEMQSYKVTEYSYVVENRTLHVTYVLPLELTGHENRIVLTGQLPATVEGYNISLSGLRKLELIMTSLVPKAQAFQQDLETLLDAQKTIDRIEAEKKSVISKIELQGEKGKMLCKFRGQTIVSGTEFECGIEYKGLDLSLESAKKVLEMMNLQPDQKSRLEHAMAIFSGNPLGIFRFRVK